MVPVSAWEFIIASVRQQYPDTIFLMEGLGGKISVTRELLNKANFNWAYSELFQNYTREQIAAYLPGSFQISSGEGLMVHFAETHDNDRLAARSLIWAEMRTALCALTSSCGGFAFAGGVEWFATEKIDVHGAAALNWGNPVNQTRRIGRLTTILKIHPVFHPGAELAVVTVSGANQVVLLRHHPRLGKRLLIIANLDDQHSATGTWPLADTGMTAGPFTDLLSGRCVELNTGDDNLCRYPLGPGDVLCLSPDPADLQTIIAAESRVPVTPERATGQRLQAKALDVVTYYKDVWDMRGFDLAQALEDLSADPEAFCRHHNPLNDESRVVIWNWPQDRRREVMVPPGYFLLVLANRPLRGRIVSRGTVLGSEESLPCRENRHFCLFTPLPTPTNHRSLTLKLSVFTNGGADHVEAPLLYLTQGRHAVFQRSFTRRDLLRRPLLFLGTNGRGGMARANVAWAERGVAMARSGE